MWSSVECKMAAATACVSTGCCSITSAREGYGRQQQGSPSNAAAKSLSRSSFCGDKVAASLKAQAWLPATPKRQNAAMGPIQVSSVLAELDEALVSFALSSNLLHE